MRDCMLFKKRLKQAGQQVARYRFEIIGKTACVPWLAKSTKYLV